MIPAPVVVVRNIKSAVEDDKGTVLTLKVKIRSMLQE